MSGDARIRRQNIGAYTAAITANCHQSATLYEDIIAETNLVRRAEEVGELGEQVPQGLVLREGVGPPVRAPRHLRVEVVELRVVDVLQEYLHLLAAEKWRFYTNLSVWMRRCHSSSDNRLSLSERENSIGYY